MQKYIGKKVLIRADGIGLAGTLIDDQKDRVIIKDDSGIEVVIIKSKIAWFSSKDVVTKVANVKSGLTVYGNFDAKGRETGKYYISDSSKDKNGIDTFSKSCKINPHWIKEMGDLFELPPDSLKKMLGGMILGEE